MGSGLLEVKAGVACSNLGSLGLPPLFKACAYDLPPNEAPEVPAVENDEAEEVTNGLFENSFPDDLNNCPDWTGN